jgi:hypothetical protein
MSAGMRLGSVTKEFDRSVALRAILGDMAPRSASAETMLTFTND